MLPRRGRGRKRKSIPQEEQKNGQPDSSMTYDFILDQQPKQSDLNLKEGQTDYVTDAHKYNDKNRDPFEFRGGEFAGNNYTFNGDDNEPFRETTVLITINTNIKTTTTDDLKTAIDRVFDSKYGNPVNIVDADAGIIKTHFTTKRGITIQGDSNKVGFWGGKYGIETGTRRSRIHAHIKMRIMHQTKLQIDAERLRDRVQKEMKELGIEVSPYVNIKMLPPSYWEDAVDAYIKKTADKAKEIIAKQHNPPKEYPWEKQQKESHNNNSNKSNRNDQQSIDDMYDHYYSYGQQVDTSEFDGI